MTSRISSSNRRSTSSSKPSVNTRPEDNSIDLSFSRWMLGGRLVAPAGQKIALRRRDASGKINKVLEIPHGKDLKDRRERRKSKIELDEPVKDAKFGDELCDKCNLPLKDHAKVPVETSKNTYEEEEKKPKNMAQKEDKKEEKKKEGECLACLEQQAEAEKQKSKENKPDGDENTQESNKKEKKDKKQEEEAAKSKDVGKTDEPPAKEDDDKADEKSTPSVGGFSADDDAKIVEMQAKKKRTADIAKELNRTTAEVGKRIGELNENNASVKKNQKKKAGKSAEGTKTDASEKEKEKEEKNTQETEITSQGDGGRWDVANTWGVRDSGNSFAADTKNTINTTATSAKDADSVDNSQLGQHGEKQTESGWLPPADAWAINLHANGGWPEAQNNDPDQTRISASRNSTTHKPQDSSSGGDWGNANFDFVTNKPGSSSNAPSGGQNSNNGIDFMMSGANGYREQDTPQTQKLHANVPDSDVNKAFAIGDIVPNFTSKPIFGSEPTEFFLQSSGISGLNGIANEPRKVHFDDAQKKEATPSAPTAQKNGNITPGNGDWNTSGDDWGENAGSNEFKSMKGTPDIASGSMPGAWDDGYATNKYDVTTCSEGVAGQNGADPRGNDASANTQAFPNTTGDKSWDAPLNTSTPLSHTLHYTLETMPGVWNPALNNSSHSTSSVQPANAAKTSLQDTLQTSFPPQGYASNRFATGLKANGTFSEEDIKSLALWAKYYEEAKWMTLQCKLYNTTGKIIPATFIKEKFEEDGVELCGKL